MRWQETLVFFAVIAMNILNSLSIINLEARIKKLERPAMGDIRFFDVPPLNPPQSRVPFNRHRL